VPSPRNALRRGEEHEFDQVAQIIGLLHKLEALLGRCIGKPKPDQRRRHDCEAVGCVAAVGERIGQQGNDLRKHRHRPWEAVQ